LEAIGIDVRIIVSGFDINKKSGVGLNFSASEEGQMVSCCKHSDENSGSIKRKKFLN
jgi:hypothetical protein